MSRYQFVITGRVMPYVRMTRLGKFVNERAKQYIASQTAIGLQLKSQMSRQGLQMLPPKTPLKLEVTTIMPDHLYTMDVDNIGKAVQDALQGIVFYNDCWIVEARFTKSLGSDHRTLILVEAL